LGAVPTACSINGIGRQQIVPDGLVVACASHQGVLSCYKRNTGAGFKGKFNENIIKKDRKTIEKGH
jgi:hypothetical protein